MPVSLPCSAAVCFMACAARRNAIPAACAGPGPAPCNLYGEPLPMEEDGGFAPYELKSYLAVRKES